MRKLLVVCSLVAVMAVVLMVSGCLIDPPKAPNRVANIIELKPQYLEQLPSSRIYEGWLVEGDTVEGAWQPHDMSEWHSFGRFNWDPYNYRPTNAAGAFIENRFDARVDVLSYDRIFITIEKTGEDETALPSGIIILQGDVDLLNIDADLEHPISTADISDFDRTENQFWIYTQSDGLLHDTTWYDTTTADMGIWFGGISKADRIIFDTLCRDPLDSSNWFLCPEGELPDTIYWCHFIDDIDTLFDTTFDTISIEPELEIDTILSDTTVDTLYFVDECPDSLKPVADSTMTRDTVYVIFKGDTAMAPSLTTMPEAVPGWKYEAWIIFRNGTPPLSLGRFSNPQGPDDDSSYCDPFYDRHFDIPGEDFFQNVPGLGSLHLVNNLEVEKLYITVEPDPDFDPAHPFMQLIMFSQYIPKPDQFYQLEGGRPSQRPAQLTFPMILRDIGSSLNEGHRWPKMHLELTREMVIK